MRILFVNKFLYRRGGSETYLFDVAGALRDMGHEVGFFSMQDGRNVPCEQSEYFVSNSDYSGKASLLQQAREAATLVYSPEAKQRFDALLRDFRPDVIHLNLVHRQITFSILDAPYLKERPVPVIYTAHDFIPVCPNCTFLDGAGMVCEVCLDGRFRHCVERRCVKGSVAKSLLASAEARFLRLHGSYRKVDRFIAPSDFMRSKLVEGGFPAEKVVVMRNFLPEEKRRGLIEKPAERQPYFLYFGRLSPEKGIEILLGAFAEGIGDLPRGWRLKIAGTGPLEDELMGRVAQIGIGDRVEFKGFCTGEELSRLVQHAAWTVVPSVWYENMPYSVVESLAAGVPVIGSDLGGIPELVKAGETGIPFAYGDVGALKSALCRAASLVPADYAQLAESCRAFVAEKCSQETYISKLTSMYGDLIQEKNGR